MRADPLTLALVVAVIAAAALAAFAFVRAARERTARLVAEREAALAHERAAEIERRQASLEEIKSQTVEAAKAAALTTSRELSSKLLDDHRRENESAAKAAEERVRKATHELHQRFESVVKTVASLNDQVRENRATVDTVWRALSSPGGAGRFAEIGLENTLKAFGLQAGRDFVTQMTVSGDSGRLRPDAVVFLPGDALLVIDSKASKFLLEVAAAEGDEAEAQAADARLAQTMTGHLRALTSKDYRGAIIEAARRDGRAPAPKRVLNVMYLPNEGALERLERAAPGFADRAAAADIVVAGPSALAALIAFARVDIDLGRQAENQDRIVEATQGLLDAVAVALGHVETVGRGLKTATDGFTKLAASINKRLLPRARKVVALGVRPAKGDMPGNLPLYALNVMKPDDVIEGESTSEPERQAIAGPDTHASRAGDSSAG